MLVRSLLLGGGPSGQTIQELFRDHELDIVNLGDSWTRVWQWSWREVTGPRG